MRSLLASAAEPASDFLDEPAFAAAPVAARAAAADPMIGRVIGNYVITSELARGGMGIVYHGRHTTLPREVVVKCLRPISGDEAARLALDVRFRREARIQCLLDHPNTVRVYEFFTEPDGCFLVMEYIDGSSVRDLLDRRGRLPCEEAKSIGAQALAGLEHAHTFQYTAESGGTHAVVVHRDIKPGNLIVDQRGQAKLTDFGIAKISGGERNVTKTGFSPGTLASMSPEQIRGLLVDPRSYLYSLGITLYEMLTGRLPYPADRTTSDYEMLKARVETDAVPVESVDPTMPPAVAAAVMRALERDPDRRWQSAAEFREALVNDTAIPVPPPKRAAATGVPRGAKLWPRR